MLYHWNKYTFSAYPSSTPSPLHVVVDLSGSMAQYYSTLLKILRDPFFNNVPKIAFSRKAKLVSVSYGDDDGNDQDDGDEMNKFAVDLRAKEAMGGSTSYSAFLDLLVGREAKQALVVTDGAPDMDDFEWGVKRARLADSIKEIKVVFFGKEKDCRGNTRDVLEQLAHSSRPCYIDPTEDNLKGVLIDALAGAITDQAMNEGKAPVLYASLGSGEENPLGSELALRDPPLVKMCCLALYMFLRKERQADLTQITRFLAEMWPGGAPDDVQLIADKMTTDRLLNDACISDYTRKTLTQMAFSPSTVLRGQLRRNFKAVSKAARTASARATKNKADIEAVEAGLNAGRRRLHRVLFLRTTFNPSDETQGLARTIIVQQPHVLNVYPASRLTEQVYLSPGMACLPCIDPASDPPPWLSAFLRTVVFTLSGGFSDHAGVFLWLLPGLSVDQFAQLEPTLRSTGRIFFSSAPSVPACLAPYGILFSPEGGEEKEVKVEEGVLKAVLRVAKDTQHSSLNAWVREHILPSARVVLMNPHEPCLLVPGAFVLKITLHHAAKLAFRDLWEDLAERRGDPYLPPFVISPRKYEVLLPHFDGHLHDALTRLALYVLLKESSGLSFKMGDVHGTEKQARSGENLPACYLRQGVRSYLTLERENGLSSLISYVHGDPSALASLAQYLTPEEVAATVHDCLQRDSALVKIPLRSVLHIAQSMTQPIPCELWEWLDGADPLLEASTILKTGNIISESFLAHLTRIATSGFYLFFLMNVSTPLTFLLFCLFVYRSEEKRDDREEGECSGALSVLYRTVAYVTLTGELPATEGSIRLINVLQWDTFLRALDDAVNSPDASSVLNRTHIVLRTALSDRAGKVPWTTITRPFFLTLIEAVRHIPEDEPGAPLNWTGLLWTTDREFIDCVKKRLASDPSLAYNIKVACHVDSPVYAYVQNAVEPGFYLTARHIDALRYYGSTIPDEGNTLVQKMLKNPHHRHFFHHPQYQKRPICLKSIVEARLAMKKQNCEWGPRGDFHTQILVLMMILTAKQMRDARLNDGPYEMPK